MNRRLAALLAALVAVSAAATAGALRLTATTAPGPATAGLPAPRASASAGPLTVVTPSGPAAPNDLTIAAMRARAYPASTLTTVRNEGDQGGYVNSVVSFESDGLREDALLSVPDGRRPAAGWPVIVINHGYSDPATYRTDGPDYGAFIAAFAHAGYMVVKPDYRGHGQSQGVALGGHLSPVYAWDLLNLVSTLRADHRVDPSRIGLFGHSMGGHEVLRALVVSKDIKAAVLLAGVVGSMYDIFYNWPNSPRTSDQPVAVQQSVEQTIIDQYGTPKSDPAFWDSASAIDYVSSITAAIQIDQDVADTTVPKAFSDHLAAALTAAGIPYQYNLYPGDDHQFLRNRTAILAATVAFYRAHL